MVFSTNDIKKSIISSILEFSLDIEKQKKSGKYNLNQISEILAIAIEINNLINHLDKDPDRGMNLLIRPELPLVDLRKMQRVLELSFKYNSDINSVAIDIGENLSNTNRYLQRGIDYILVNISKKDYKNLVKTKAPKVQQTSPRPALPPKSPNKKKGPGFFGFVFFMAILVTIAFFIYNMIFNQHATSVTSLVKEYRSDALLSSIDRPETISELKVSGTKALLNVFLDNQIKFSTANKDLRYEILGEDSGEAIRDLIDGKISLASSSKIPSIEERRKAAKQGRSLADHKIALDAVVVFVNPSNPIETLSLASIAKIYSTNQISWKQAVNISNNPNPIKCFALSKQSGTYAFFVERVLYGEPMAGTVINLYSPEQLLEMVSSDSNAIGFASLSVFNSKDIDIKKSPVKILRIATEYNERGTKPLADTGEIDINSIRQGDYPLTRYLYIISAGELDSAQAKFIDFMRSDEVQAKLLDHGLVSVF